jgi:hypothetical protein
VIRQAHREAFEEGVQRSEVRALDVPVGDLELGVLLEAVGEALVEGRLNLDLVRTRFDPRPGPGF